MFGWFEQRLNPFPSEEPVAPPKGLFAFCWHYSKTAAPWLGLIAVLTALIAIGEVALFQFLGDIIGWLTNADRATFLEREGHKLFWMAALVLVGLPLTAGLESFIMHQVMLGNYQMSARWQMHRFLLRHSMSFFVNEAAGCVGTKVMQTSIAVRETVIRILDVFVYVIIYFLTMIVMVAAADWRLMIPILVWLAVYIGIVAYFVPRLRKIAAAQADARSMMTGRVVDCYTNIETIKLFSHAGREEVYARESMGEFLQIVHKQLRKVALFHICVYLNNCVALFVISGQSIWFWLSGAISVGTIAIAIGLATRFNFMSQWIMREVTALFENIGTVYDGMEMMSNQHEIVDKPGAPTLMAKKGAIHYDRIRFHYGKSESIIDDVSLDIRAGEKIGLVGRSGTGKTTLMRLLLRYYDPEAGRITIDGQDIAGVSQESLRSQIGVVTQDTSLLDRSIRDNIAYGRPEATDDEVIEAAKRANAWEFIEGLVDMQGRAGLDAQVGERGATLSGGQRQRILIARVFLKDAPILVLDEATSALDSEVEAAIQKNLFALMEGKTVIATAHRLSTLTEMDRLIVLDKGRIIEAGSHSELIAGGGIYADLWNLQSGGTLSNHPEEAEVAAE
ncbi:ABC transporter ATP-binding protein [Rhizobium brockwellii]|uniref:ABC transporter ATP-binding protein n=1 Tax=Rhizobium brockwellii TaxID=3019932 RepID=A0ABU3YXY6_9HYPH|nr:ABC transporter ATP-binding protein [Rhizobium brockwellii]MDV4183674.1 ABC transporter ATP-binding protein [Rhizobium brockwellii]MDV4190664.1 ABC transporter ATP-binding protein [Rhizobium brockwellii]